MGCDEYRSPEELRRILGGDNSTSGLDYRAYNPSVDDLKSLASNPSEISESDNVRYGDHMAYAIEVISDALDKGADESRLAEIVVPLLTRVDKSLDRHDGIDSIIAGFAYRTNVLKRASENN